ncbi:50S ribosomal protein L40e [Candidatus Woesearchaeota archaeon]|nr:50S ribosomal protein L40e [Candidatus Woesearchaeota archaeon]
MAKFPEAEARRFHRVFICKKCKHKIRADNTAVIAGKVKCRYCGSKALRPVRKK